MDREESTSNESLEGLLERMQEGDEKARNEIFALIGDEQRLGAVLRHAVRKYLPRRHPARQFLDSCDVLQSAIVTGMNEAHAFRGKTEGEFFRWFRTILRTKVSRANRRCLAKGEAVGDMHPVTKVYYEMTARRDRGRKASTPLKEIIENELQEELLSAIQSLPLESRVVIELRLRGCTTAEISRILGMQEASIRKRESRAVKKLQDELA